MKKLNNFKLLFKYLNKDKLKIFVYVLLELSTYVPALCAAFLCGRSLEELLAKRFDKFVLYFAIWVGIYILYRLFIKK